MHSSPAQLVLLPGMDGTGELFQGFTAALPDGLNARIIRYPTSECLSSSELVALVGSSVSSSEPIVLLAESYSTPLAIQYAATHPPNLKGLVLCAGFVSSPARSWKRRLCLILAPILFRITPPKFVIRYLLLGSSAPLSLLAEVQAAISAVEVNVLMARLREVLDCDVRAELSRVEVPIFYLQARQDRLIPDWCCTEILRIQPETVVEVIDGPHLVLQRESKQAAMHVSKFFQEL
jgi:pimeloyl-ACP methyl ester carboxylesterase